MTRRRTIKPDHRLDWRDPNMPVLGKSGHPIDHRKMVIKSEMSLSLSLEPHYTNDPTYNLRKPRK